MPRLLAGLLALAALATLTSSASAVSAPAGRTDRARTDEDSATRIAVLRNDAARPGQRNRITAVRTGRTKGAVTISATGRSVRYDPHGAFEHLGDGQRATDRFSYVSGGRVIQVRVAVAGVRDIPPLGDFPVAVGENTLGNYFPIVGEYASPDMQALTLASVTQPTYGKSYVADSTTFGYDAALGYCNNGNPTDNFTITVVNPSGETETSSVMVYVPCS